MPEQAIDPAGAALVGAYYLDRSLTNAESTRRFSEDGRGREVLEERYYVVAIRRSGQAGWVFRFSHYNEKAFLPIVQMLNRLAREQVRAGDYSTRWAAAASAVIGE